jgi:solute carrier family 25 (adenine nucleotide translocator) protein 4/5/6/31
LEGVGALWRGNLTNTMRYVPSIGLNFYFKSIFYSLFKVHEYSHLPVKQFFISLLAAGTGGACTEAIVYPLDFARTRLAVDVLVGNNKR